MTKQELMRLIRLLSAAETLLLYTGHKHLNEREQMNKLLEELSQCAEILEREILK